MESLIEQISKKYLKASVVKVKSGDTVKVHQKIKEGNKERIQVFQGLVIKTTQPKSHMSRITVRRIASGVGVEKSFLLHSPLIVKVEVTKRSKVRRNYLTYMRQRTGKSARLSSVDFDRNEVNKVNDIEPPKDTKPVETTNGPARAPRPTSSIPISIYSLGVSSGVVSTGLVSLGGSISFTLLTSLRSKSTLLNLADLPVL